MTIAALDATTMVVVRGRGVRGTDPCRNESRPGNCSNNSKGSMLVNSIGFRVQGRYVVYIWSVK